MEVKTISPLNISFEGYDIKLMCLDFPLKIRSLTGKVIEINAYDKMTIFKLKSEIEKINKVSINRQRIIFNGNQLEDDKTLKYYSIHTNSVVHICIRR